MKGLESKIVPVFIYFDITVTKHSRLLGHFYIYFGYITVVPQAQVR